MLQLDDNRNSSIPLKRIQVVHFLFVKSVKNEMKGLKNKAKKISKEKLLSEFLLFQFRWRPKKISDLQKTHRRHDSLSNANYPIIIMIFLVNLFECRKKNPNV